MISINMIPSADEKTKLRFADPYRPRKFVTRTFIMTVFPYNMAMVSASMKLSLLVWSAFMTWRSFVYLVVVGSVGNNDTTDQKKLAALPNRLLVNPVLTLTLYVQSGIVVIVLEITTVGFVISPPVTDIAVNCVLSNALSHSGVRRLTWLKENSIVGALLTSKGIGQLGFSLILKVVFEVFKS